MIRIAARRTVVALALALSAVALPAPVLAQTPTPTASPFPSATPTTAPLTLTADRQRIDYGQSVGIDVVGRAGATVQVFGNGRQIRTATLGGELGNAQFILQPGDRTLFSAIVDGRQSQSVTVEVRRTVTIGISQASGIYTFTGHVARAEAGLQVTIARLASESGRVTGMASTRTDASGRYVVRTALPQGLSGYYALTGVSSAGALQPGRSRLYGLLVDTRPNTVPRAPAPVARSLSGRTVTLDPGHNGGNAASPAAVNARVDAGGGLYKPCNTVGTAARSGYPEHAFNWDVSRRVAALLRARGAQVVMTRADDTGAGPCIGTRAAIGNAALSDVVVSIHGDGNTGSAARGFHVIAPLSPPVAPAVVAQSDRLAQHLRAAYLETTGIPYANYLAGGDGLDARRDLGGLNLSTRPVVFIECGNMRNSADAALMTTAVGRQRIAAGIAAGISTYLTRA